MWEFGFGFCAGVTFLFVLSHFSHRHAKNKMASFAVVAMQRDCAMMDVHDRSFDAMFAALKVDREVRDRITGLRTDRILAMQAMLDHQTQRTKVTAANK